MPAPTPETADEVRRRSGHPEDVENATHGAWSGFKESDGLNYGSPDFFKQYDDAVEIYGETRTEGILREVRAAGWTSAELKEVKC